MRVWSRQLRSLWLKVLTVLASAGLGQTPAVAEPINPYWSGFAGGFGEIFVHESGHAITMLSLGWGVSSFRPFPNICNGKFVGGCVIFGNRFGNGLLPFLSSTSKSVLISASGSLFSMISVLAVAPEIPRTKNDFNRKTLDTMTYLQVRDFPFYVIADLIGFGGDWQSVSKNLGISLWWFVPLAAGQYLVLDKYWQRFHDKAVELYEPEFKQSQLKARVFWLPGLRLKI